MSTARAVTEEAQQDHPSLASARGKRPSRRAEAECVAAAGVASRGCAADSGQASLINMTRSPNLKKWAS